MRRQPCRHALTESARTPTPRQMQARGRRRHEGQHRGEHTGSTRTLPEHTLQTLGQPGGGGARRHRHLHPRGEAAGQTGDRLHLHVGAAMGAVVGEMAGGHWVHQPPVGLHEALGRCGGGQSLLTASDGGGFAGSVRQGGCLCMVEALGNVEHCSCIEVQ